MRKPVFSPDRRLARFATRLARKLGLGWSFCGPDLAYLEPTTRCNLNCKTCPRHYYGGDFYDVDPLVYDRYMEEVLPRIETANLQGYGEPLVHPRFPEMLDRIEEAGKQLMIICNSLLLRPPIQERFVKMGAHICLSVDGGSNETMRYVRERVDYDRILRVLERFRDLREQYPDTGFTITVNVVLLRCNIHEMPSLIEDMARLGVAKVTMTHFHTAQRPDEFTEECLDRHPELVRRHFPAIRETARRVGMPIDLPCYDFEHETTSAGKTVDAPPPREPSAHERRTGFRQKCYAPWNRLYVTVDGNVQPCCYSASEVMGNLKEQSFEEIWNSERYRRLRRSVNTANPPAYCRECNLNTGINAGPPPNRPSAADEAAPVRL